MLSSSKLPHSKHKVEETLGHLSGRLALTGPLWTFIGLPKSLKRDMYAVSSSHYGLNVGLHSVSVDVLKTHNLFASFHQVSQFYAQSKHSFPTQMHWYFDVAFTFMILPALVPHNDEYSCET